MNPENFIDTILDQIIPDLWPIINEYCRTQPIFAVGKIWEKYSNYHLITEDDLKNKMIIDSFVEYYKKNKGISSLDDFSGVYVCGDDIDIGMHGRCLQYSHSSVGTPQFIKKFSIINFYTKDFDAGIITKFLDRIIPMTFQPSTNNTGLFVIDNINNIIPDNKKNDKK